MLAFISASKWDMELLGLFVYFFIYLFMMKEIWQISIIQELLACFKIQPHNGEKKCFWILSFLYFPDILAQQACANCLGSPGLLCFYGENHNILNLFNQLAIYINQQCYLLEPIYSFILSLFLVVSPDGSFFLHIFTHSKCLKYLINVIYLCKVYCEVGSCGSSVIYKASSKSYRKICIMKT